ncbi:MAG TPA: DUF2934 domain-containing protein [Steroidobacteraceae bacterium]|nr:DUF2934 domain-containing protein [Steroidobacteraceae bacterium]
MNDVPASDSGKTPPEPAAKPARTARKPAKTAKASPAATKSKAKAAPARERKPAVAKAPAANRRRESAAPEVAAPTDVELAQMVATAAYFIAEKRSFAPGYELEDWLTAESQIRQLTNAPTTSRQ